MRPLNKVAFTVVPFFLFFSSSLFSQDQRILGSFIFDQKCYNFEFTREEENVFTFKISQLDPSKASSDAEHTFSDFNKSVFDHAFTDQMVNIYSTPDSDALKEKSSEVFYMIKLRYDVLDDEPVTAYLIQRSNTVTSLLKSNTSVFYEGELSGLTVGHYVKRVNVEIADGAIKNLIVKVVKNSPETIRDQSPRKYIEFKNQFPISISGKFDPEYFNKIYLYCFDCNSIEGLTRYIKLSDLLSLDIVLENNKEDYSPTDRTVTLSPLSPIAELKKEKRTRLIELAAFSDFAGLDQNEPNGLIQFEARRKLNINTRYKLLGGRKKVNENLASKIDFADIDTSIKPIIDPSSKTARYTLNTKTADQKPMTIEVKNTKFHSTYYNWFGSLEPKLLFSKLDQNNRYVGSGAIINNRVDPVSLYQYQLVSFGMTLQVYRLSFPELKFSWNVLHGGIYWFRTRLETGVDAGTSVPVDSHYSQLGSSFVFRPDSRWGVIVGFDYLKSSIWNPDYSLSTTHALHQPYFDGFLKTNEYDKLFFRFRWTYEHTNRDNNFIQIQLGYSKNLFGGGEKSSQGAQAP